MKRTTHLLPALLVTTGLLAAAGCGRQTRGNADAENQSRAATPAEGGATSTTGSAGEAKNFGDTRARTQEEGKSDTASPTGLSKDAKAGGTSDGVNSTGQKPAPNR